MESINIEEIMKGIRAEIKEKGLVDTDVQYSDIADLMSGDNVPFNLDAFKTEIEEASKYKTVESYRDVRSTRAGVGGIITFFKKFFRKTTAFYVEPIVDDQNRYNDAMVRALVQMTHRFAEDDAKINGLEKKLYETEKKLRQLQEQLDKSEK